MEWFQNRKGRRKKNTSRKVEGGKCGKGTKGSKKQVRRISPPPVDLNNHTVESQCYYRAEAPEKESGRIHEGEVLLKKGLRTERRDRGQNLLFVIEPSRLNLSIGKRQRSEGSREKNSHVSETALKRRELTPKTSAWGIIEAS